MFLSQHKLTRLVLGALALATLTFGSVIPAGAQTKRRPAPHLKKGTAVKKPIYYSVKAGSVIRARMNQTLSSKNSTIGESFSATVVDPVYASNGTIVIPPGSILHGVVTSVVKAQKKGKPGMIDLAFRSVRLPNGLTRAINGSLTDLRSDSTTSDNEGSATGGSMKHRHLVFIGGGAGAGAVLGAVAGGGKGLGIGALVGGGAGAAADYFLKGKEAEVKSGTEFGVILNVAVALPPFKSNV